jgi:outer membrane biosynthesis protein TonB
MSARARAETVRARLQRLAEELEEQRKRELEEWAKLRDLALRILKQVEAEIARRRQVQQQKAPPAPPPATSPAPQPAPQPQPAQQKTTQQPQPAQHPSGGSAQPAGGGGARKGFEALV